MDRGALDGLTGLLGSDYKAWKAAEKQKDSSKGKFFEAATEQLSKEIPAQVVEEVIASDVDSAALQAQKKFPRYRVLDSERIALDRFRVVLEEDPALRTFRYVNHADGMVYQRTVVEGSPVLDDDRLQEEDPDLWQQVTHVPEPQRELKPLDDLSEEQLAKLSEYLYAGKPTVKLQAPRKAKEEELNE